ncbi:hypothetical protein CTA1_10330 [Colletotrichum tanaceti]|uniref:Uncharacterized protein n=1 Tax=Colletotrichum tanaceti TaxID=1306861 RepID=A0A4U6X872_9PEZI|nr:hypothetical protein CTA1_10330 [Colletotrichum tanaceti]
MTSKEASADAERTGSALVLAAPTVPTGVVVTAAAAAAAARARPLNHITGAGGPLEARRDIVRVPDRRRAHGAVVVGRRARHAPAAVPLDARHRRPQAGHVGQGVPSVVQLAVRRLVPELHRRAVVEVVVVVVVVVVVEVHVGRVDGPRRRRRPGQRRVPPRKGRLVDVVGWRREGAEGRVQQLVEAQREDGPALGAADGLHGRVHRPAAHGDDLDAELAGHHAHDVGAGRRAVAVGDDDGILGPEPRLRHLEDAGATVAGGGHGRRLHDVGVVVPLHAAAAAAAVKVLPARKVLQVLVDEAVEAHGVRDRLQVDAEPLRRRAGPVEGPVGADAHVHVRLLAALREQNPVQGHGVGHQAAAVALQIEDEPGLALSPAGFDELDGDPAEFDGVFQHRLDDAVDGQDGRVSQDRIVEDVAADVPILMDHEGERVSLQRGRKVSRGGFELHLRLAVVSRDFEAVVDGAARVDAGEVGHYTGGVDDGRLGAVGELNDALVRESGVVVPASTGGLENVCQGRAVELLVVRRVGILVSRVVGGSLLEVVDDGRVVEGLDLGRIVPLLQASLVVGYIIVDLGRLDTVFRDGNEQGWGREVDQEGQSREPCQVAIARLDIDQSVQIHGEVKLRFVPAILERIRDVVETTKDVDPWVQVLFRRVGKNVNCALELEPRPDVFDNRNISFDIYRDRSQTRVCNRKLHHHVV